MTTAIKRKFIYVEPISSMAKLRFDTEMDGLHSCYIDDEREGTIFLSSVNGKYKFSMKRKEDSNWVIIK